MKLKTLQQLKVLHNYFRMTLKKKKKFTDIIIHESDRIDKILIKLSIYFQMRS